MAAAFMAPSVDAKTLRTVTVDGNLADWTDVLLDRDQKIADRSLAQGDPDLPSQSQRDERGVAFTWDATNLYLYFSRTGSGTNSFNAIFYFDLGHDGLLSSADRIALFKMTGSNFNGFELDVYDDGGTPDSLGADGATPAGMLGATLATTGANAAADANGIAFEASILWTTLGVPAGTPMLVHPAISSNSNLPAGVQDNTDNLDTRLPAVALTAGRTSGTAPGRAVDFPHRVTNDGTATDTIDLALRTRLGFSVAVHSDPNGDGDPSDGVLLALDANGDGDMTDIGDIAPSAPNDANGNDLVDGGTLAPGASRSFVLRVTVPAGQAIGTEELVHVDAISGYRPAVRTQATDTLRVGLVVLVPDRSLVAGRGQGIGLAHVACNQSGASRVIDVTFTSSEGWSGTLFSDPDGDGDPSDGAALADSDGDTLPDLGNVADATCASLVLVLAVPGTAMPGTIDSVTVTASDGAPISASVADRVEVTIGRVDVRPDRTVKGQQGKTLYLRHDVLNASPGTDSYALSLTSTLGSQVAAMNDPNDDGDPDDSVVVATTGAVAGNGGRFPMLSRVRIRPTAVHGNVDLVDTRAQSGSWPDSDLARDTINVVGTLTYSDPLFARPTSEFFGQCSITYVLAFRSGGGTYRFVWHDPLGFVQRTSADIQPYSDGSLDDFYDLGANPLLGTWMVKLQSKSGASYVDVGPAGTALFDLQDLVAGGAAITLNDTGSDIYLLAGDVLSGFADLRNPTGIDIVGSRVEHVAYFDADGNGAPDAGEDYVLANGTIAAWAPGLVTASRPGLDVYAGEQSSDRFVTAPVTYSRNGAWKLRSRWIGSCGAVYSTRSVTFTVGCQPPPTFAGLEYAQDIDPCAYSGIMLSWSPATSWGLGSGGTYAVYRSTTPGFTPDSSNLLVAGLGGTSYVDASAAPDVDYEYVVRAESDVTCSDGPNNAGLMDANFVHGAATDADVGIVPVADFSSSSPECLVAGSATMDFTDTSSGPPASWTWDFDGDGVTDATTSTASFTYFSAGTHFVRLTVTNTCGMGTITRSVTVGEPPSAIIGMSALETCAGTSLDVDGRASSAAPPSTLASHSWDFDGDGIPDSAAAYPGAVSWASAGLYRVTLTVTDSLGCASTDSVDVQVNDALVVTPAPPIVDQCTGDASVTAVVTGGRGPYAFAWDILADDGAGTGSATFAFGSSQTANVVVTDAAGCTAMAASMPIAVNPALSVTLDPPIVDQCTGLVVIRARASGGDGTRVFGWIGLVDDGTGLGTATLPPGTHRETVTVTDGNSCSAQADVDFDVIAPVTGMFAWNVVYISPGQYRADLAATSADGLAPHSFSWDVGADGIPDAAGATASFAIAANATVPVELTVTDANGCAAVTQQDVVAGGCPVDTPVELLMVRKQGTGLGFTWQPSVHSCHARYDLLEASTARPLDGRNGTFPVDPAWTTLQPSDADGSDQDPQLLLDDPRAGQDRYFLARDGGTDGSWGPTGSYGNTGVTSP